MHYYEDPNNTAARASNNAERTRWRNEGVDPELVADPFDTAQAVEAQEAARVAEAERAAQVEQATRPLGALLGARLFEASN